MSVSTVNAPSSASVLPNLGVALTACGLTKVTDSFTANVLGINGGTVQVWRSTGNSYGEDWYLIVGEAISGGSRILAYSVCEGWDDATKAATRPIPPSPNGITPQADFSAYAAPVVLNNTTQVIYWQNQNWTDVAGTTLTIVGDLNRVLFIITSSLSQSIYAGKMDRFYPTSIDPVAPLGVLAVGNGSGSISAIWGGCTREPGQTAANNYNWRMQLNSTSGAQAAGDRVVTLNSGATVADGVTTRPTPSPVAPHCSRYFNSSTRGLLRDVRMTGNTSSAAADTLTETATDGTTKAYVAASGIGIFAAT